MTAAASPIAQLVTSPAVASMMMPTSVPTVAAAPRLCMKGATA